MFSKQFKIVQTKIKKVKIKLKKIMHLSKATLEK
jgi:hypothetical protein